MTIGEKIKSVRVAAGLTQKDLGAFAGMSQQRIAQYESGYRVPKEKALNAIASAIIKSGTPEVLFYSEADEPFNSVLSLLIPLNDILCNSILKKRKTILQSLIRFPVSTNAAKPKLFHTPTIWRTMRSIKNSPTASRIRGRKAK